MISLVIVLITLTSLAAQAERAQVRIESIDPGRPGEEHLLLLEDGRVAFLPYHKKELLHDLPKDMTLELEMDQDHNVLSLQSLEQIDREQNLEAEATPFQPSVLSELPAVYSLYASMRRDYQEKAQCYNMAHVWAYEAYKSSKLKSMKLFLFFTRRYIREYRFHWWFHVAPMVLVKNQGNSERMVLDRRYTALPLDIKTWTKHFIQSGKDCKEVKKWKEYRNYQQSQDCYLIETSMYFWQPRDIVRRDENGAVKKSFRESEVKHAYEEAF